MTKRYFVAIAILAAGALLSGNTRAQQAPASKPSTPSSKAAQAPAAKTQGAHSAKAGSSTAAQKKPASKNATVLSTQKEKSSYAIGLNIGKGMHRDQLDVDPNYLMKGLKDGLSGANALMTDDEIKSTLTQLQAEVRKMQADKVQKEGEANIKEGQAFLAANKAKDGVVTLPDGLQYKILTEGAGPKPAATDTVVCNYRGTLIDGTEFDSSYKRGQPATFGVSQVIRGWTEALQLMPVGSKWQLFIPAELAYGPRAAGPDIAPNATLIFEVELLSIQPKGQPQTQPRPQQ